MYFILWITKVCEEICQRHLFSLMCIFVVEMNREIHKSLCLTKHGIQQFLSSFSCFGLFIIRFSYSRCKSLWNWLQLNRLIVWKLHIIDMSSVFKVTSPVMTYLTASYSVKIVMVVTVVCPVEDATHQICRHMTEILQFPVCLVPVVMITLIESEERGVTLKRYKACKMF